MAGYADILKQLLRGLMSDVSTNTSPTTAREEAETTVDQALSVPLTFSLAATTAAATGNSLRLPTPANTNWKVRNCKLVIESGALGASLTDYLTVTVQRAADGAATTWTTVGAWNTTTDTLALGAIKDIPLTAANVLVTGGSLRVALTKTGAGQTSGVANVTVEMTRRSD